jgi:hypothetical protein
LFPTFFDLSTDRSIVYWVRGRRHDI